MSKYELSMTQLSQRQGSLVREFLRSNDPKILEQLGDISREYSARLMPKLLRIRRATEILGSRL
jgi:hypothetical protein